VELNPGFFKITSMEKDVQSRRRFLRWGTGVAGAVGVFFGWKFLLKPDTKPQTTRMLTQDGTLVEVDVRHLKNPEKKATRKDIQRWIKR
jgi:hypothetical protein